MKRKRLFFLTLALPVLALAEPVRLANGVIGRASCRERVLYTV